VRRFDEASFVFSVKGAAFNLEPAAPPQVSWRAETPALKARFSFGQALTPK